MKWKPYPSHIDSGIELLGPIPSHWKARKIKHMADVRLSNVDKLSADGQAIVRLANYVDVYRNERITADMDLMVATATDDQTEKLTLAAQDVVITKDSESPDDIAVPAYVPESMEGVVCGYHLALLRPDGDMLHGGFLFRWLQGKVSQAFFTTHANGMTRYGIGKGDIGDAPILWAPMEEQKAIAAFLDHETAQIDTLIAEQRTLIEWLKEKRQAMTNHLVTKGLNPHTSVKESSIDGIGPIPAHWGVRKLKLIAEVRGGVAKGKDLAGLSTVRVPYLRVANVQDGYLDLAEVEEIEIPTRELERYLLQAGDVLMNEGGDFDKLGRGHVWQGEISPCIHQNHVFSVRPHGVRSEWLNAVSGSAYAQFFFMGRAKQSTNLASISASNLSELPVVLPPEEEQVQILAALGRETSEVDTLIAESETSIALLQEHRSALITAVVTGKVDVRDAMQGEAHGN